MTFGVMSWSLVAAVLIALALGGDFRHLSEVRIRAWWLFALAFVLKFSLLAVHAPPSPWAQPLIFAFVVAGAAMNWRLPGVPLVAFGLLLNVACVAANGGAMPFSRSAWTAAGKPSSQIASGAATLSLPQSSGTRLRWLDDRIPFSPTKQVVSVGDLFIIAGGAWLVIALSKPTRPKKNPEAHASGSSGLD